MVHRRTAAIVVAHPDDETLWAGGLMLAYPDWNWYVACLCRASDTDRAPRFNRVLATLGAHGALADLDDGPEQAPLADTLVQDTIVSLLPDLPFDLLITHGPRGEYTRHRRHEETSRAVCALWQAGRLSGGQLWLFAYRDDGHHSLPQVDPAADRRDVLTEPLWRQKYRLVTEVYGFAAESWEARATPHSEAFWCFSPQDGPRLDRLLDRLVPSP